MNLAEQIRKQPQWLIIAEALFLVLIVGSVDIYTAYDVSLFVLYSLPILFVVWFSSNRKAGVIISLACTVAWIISEAAAGHPDKRMGVVLWNSILQLGFFFFTMVCSFALKFQLDQTQAEVAALKPFHILAEISPVGIFQTGPEGETVYINQRWCNLTGRHPREALRRKWTEALHPDDSERVAREWADAQRDNRTLQFQARFRGINGDSIWALGHVAPELDATGGIRGYVGAIADLTQHRQLEQQVLEVSEREQRRIGQDLHDDLCQFLAAIQFAASSLRADLQRKGIPEGDDAQELANYLKEAIVRTRNLARRIFPVQLEQAGLISALHELTASTSRIAGIACTFEYDPPLSVNDDTAATHLYRIAQEALNNAIRHGNAQNVAIDLRTHDGIVTLTVSDDGKGIPYPLPHDREGMGLRIMEYRSHMIGGTLQIGHRPGGGTMVSCSFRRCQLPPPSASVADPQEAGEAASLSIV